MKELNKHITWKTLIATIIASFYTLVSYGQDSTNININSEEVESWFSQNWIWVVGGIVVLIILIGLFSGGSRTTKKTTVVREENGDGTVRTTTTEINE